MVYGRLIGSFALDMADPSPALRELLSTIFAGLRDFVADLIAGAARQGAVTLDSEAFGDQFPGSCRGFHRAGQGPCRPRCARRGLGLLGAHLDLLVE